MHSSFAVGKVVRLIHGFQDAAVEIRVPNLLAVKQMQGFGGLPGAVVTAHVLVAQVERVRWTHEPIPYLLLRALVARTTETVGIAEQPLENASPDAIDYQNDIEWISCFSEREQSMPAPSGRPPSARRMNCTPSFLGATSRMQGGDSMCKPRLVGFGRPGRAPPAQWRNSHRSAPVGHQTPR